MESDAGNSDAEEDSDTDAAPLSSLTTQVSALRVDDSQTRTQNSTPTKGTTQAFVVDERRVKDHAFCQEHFVGRVSRVSAVDQLMEAMGGNAMLVRLMERRNISEGKGKRMPTLKDRTSIFEKYKLEASILALEKGERRVKKGVVKKSKIDGKVQEQQEKLRSLELEGAKWLKEWAEFVSFPTFAMF